MSSIRALVRQILLEYHPQSSLNQRRIYDRQNADSESAWGFFAPPKANRPPVVDGKLQDEYPEQTRLRRDMKRIWNENADHRFFREDVTCIHWINYVANHNSSKRTFVQALRRILEGNPKKRPGDRSKNEFSCLGYLNEQWKGKGDGYVGLKIDQKNSRVTFAAVVDAWTEFNYGTHPETRRYYRHSGLPKRPDRGINHHQVIFDRDDFVRSGEDKMKECIVDNWKWNTIVIDSTQKSTTWCQDLLTYIENWNEDHPQQKINIEFF